MFEFLLTTAFATQVQTTQVDLPSDVGIKPVKTVAFKKREKASTIPLQIPISDEKRYSAYRDRAAEFLLNPYSNECARFVNRMFFVRFGKLIYGNAWDLQLKTANQKFLNLVWQLPEKEFLRNYGLRLRKKEDRIKHFQKLYSVLQNEKHPIGVLGFVYRYSFFKNEVASLKNTLPQTHVAFLAGRKWFYFENDSDRSRTLETVLTEKYGVIHDFEREFVGEHVPLRKVLRPGERIYYQDFLVEEQFKKVRSGSLLALYLRKHRNNRVTSLLRPVSYSRISDNLIREINVQRSLIHDFGGLEVVRGSEFDEYFSSETERANWEQTLVQKFNIKDPEKVIWVPVPEKREQVVRGE